MIEEVVLRRRKESSQQAFAKYVAATGKVVYGSECFALPVMLSPQVHGVEGDKCKLYAAIVQCEAAKSKRESKQLQVYQAYPKQNQTSRVGGGRGNVDLEHALTKRVPMEPAFDTLCQ